MHRTFVNELFNFRKKSIKEFLMDPNTLIVIHRHKSNDYNEFVKDRISINIIHKTSMMTIMVPMATMIMTQLFRN